MDRRDTSIDLSDYPQKDREAIISVFRNHRTSSDVMKLMSGRRFKRHMQRSASSGIIAMGAVSIVVGILVRYFPGREKLANLLKNN